MLTSIISSRADLAFLFSPVFSEVFLSETVEGAAVEILLVDGWEEMVRGLSTVTAFLQNWQAK